VPWQPFPAKVEDIFGNEASIELPNIFVRELANIMVCFSSYYFLVLRPHRLRGTYGSGDESESLSEEKKKCNFLLSIVHNNPQVDNTLANRPAGLQVIFD